MPPKSNTGRRCLELKRDIALRRIDECLSAGHEALESIDRLPIFLSRYSKLESYCSSFESNHLKLCTEITDESELNNADEIRQEFDTKYFTIIDIYSKLKTDEDSSNESESESRRTSVKLPKLNLLHFNGDLHAWGTFHEMYNTMVHRNRSISNVEKFSILMSIVHDEPRRLLEGYTISEHTYLDAYAALIARYQCKRRIAFRHWEDMQNVKIKSNSPHELRHLHDTFKKNLAVLKNHKMPVHDWDFPLFYMLINKLDDETRRRFEQQNKNKNDIPSFDSLMQFVDEEGKALELAKPNSSGASSRAAITTRRPAPSNSVANANKATSKAFIANSSTSTGNNARACIICQGDHPVHRCPSYQGKSPRDRFDVVKQHSLCMNCLRPGHVVKSCPSTSRCFKCNVPHHTTIHFEDSNRSNTTAVAGNNGVASSTALLVSGAETSAPPVVSSTAQSGQPAVTLVAGLSPSSLSLLATANVEIIDSFGNYRTIRVVVDSGSQSNFITKRCARRLGLPLHKSETLIEGIGQSSHLTTNAVSLQLRCADSVMEVEALALPQICSQMPNTKIDISQWTHLKTLQLADPKFHLPGPVDALVGVNVFCQIFSGERIDFGSDGPTAFNTKLGWIVMGKVPQTSVSNTTLSSSIPSSVLLCTLESLDSQIRKFWEIDELPQTSTPTCRELVREMHYERSHTRDEHGRYIVRLPLKDRENVNFGDSYNLAQRRLFTLEKRLARNPQLRKDYNAFMQDYLDSHHMERTDKPRTPETYYIPHHCVLKPSSTTTKLRVVFDATARPPGGDSLNDHLYVGPKLQSDIGSILLRFRLHAVVFTADMKQMYRQILIAPEDRDFQRILFRFSTDKPIREYRLNTVTYGMASSSFLALRTIHQVAMDEAAHNDTVRDVLVKDVYVDDVVTGSESLEAAQILQKEVAGALERGGFELRKWTSNDPALLENIPPEHRLTDARTFDSDAESPIKVLGLEWKPTNDSFSFSVSPRHEQCTKRNVLSELAHIFDPLGFLTPIILAFKCIVQKLWNLGLGWDDNAPDAISQDWSRYRSDLPLLSSLDIPRFVPVLSAQHVQMHGFCDASEAGYAAVIYFRIEHNDNNVTTHLIMSRSKVAPTKTLSIPRLELCAAVLLSDLVEHVKGIFDNKVQFDGIYCWSDSTVTLSWLMSPSSRWKTYVSNRVAHVQERVPASQWRHVRTEHNPADCASRGLSAKDLVNHPLWWAGPQWLTSPQYDWPQLVITNQDSSVVHTEQRNTETSLFVVVEHFDEFLNKYSSLNKIQRIVGYIRRFIHNCRHPSVRKSGHLVASEMKDSMLTLVRLAQASGFSDEIAKMKQGLALPKPMRKLQPFFDQDGLIRVGGRLTHSELDYDCKHPHLLPYRHRLTDLIIDQTHKDNQHPGLRTLSFLLAQNYWIISSRRAINGRLSRCIKCFRANPIAITPRMADLPKLRVSQVKPFSCIGVDFAGPFPTHIQRYRGSRTFKTYVCIFICFATKAVHIELVAGLTTEAFIAALRRFIARRGRCQKIHCDRGTNFVGAYNALLPYMQQAAATEAIEFSFNPPSSPHFGGLWEISVKSFKTHLARVVGQQILTYEELLTLIAQIEALMNSRPLCEMGSDPNDMSVLTPGHFLTLEPLTSLPEPQIQNMSCPNRWQLVQRLHLDFWKRWHVEYLHTLNQRAKWHTDATEPKLGSLVLIKDEQLKPLSWSLGRITQLYPGRDGASRVASVNTCSGQLIRPLVKLCPLPLD